MDTKNLSPAFFTSIATIFVGALILGFGTSFIALLGWLILVAGILLNVFSTLVVIQKAKGGPLPEMIVRVDSHSGSGTSQEKEKEEEQSQRYLEPEPDTEAQDIVTSHREEETEANERIFSRNRPRVRNR